MRECQEGQCQYVAQGALLRTPVCLFVGERGFSGGQSVCEDWCGHLMEGGRSPGELCALLL